MAWNGEHRKNCRECGREREPGEVFSARGRCEACGVGLMTENYLQLKAHKGPHFTHWRNRCLRSFGVGLPDE